MPGDSSRARQRRPPDAGAATAANDPQPRGLGKPNVPTAPAVTRGTSPGGRGLGKTPRREMLPVAELTWLLKKLMTPSWG